MEFTTVLFYREKACMVVQLKTIVCFLMHLFWILRIDVSWRDLSPDYEGWKTCIVVFAVGVIKVYTEIVDDCSAATLQSIIQGKTSTDGVIHSDGWRGYNRLVYFGHKKHIKVHHVRNEFVRGNSHINGIESFWKYSKTRLVKFKSYDTHYR